MSPGMYNLARAAIEYHLTKMLMTNTIDANDIYALSISVMYFNHDKDSLNKLNGHFEAHAIKELSIMWAKVNETVLKSNKLGMESVTSDLAKIMESICIK